MTRNPCVHKPNDDYEKTNAIYARNIQADLLHLYSMV
ncbi:predicted protein [Plenodomus lingam JN3]|uniref:Predicted protein n=1 Tax=Leptosphaeria maculans (strain JN3 / isolate v23.1.3 / race Av1-4-5-6-7-8) TaxID=985895 RepID=E4ZHA6_LEPMJ|nr:predicted protein [Plenodomus lingam JN3]CBX90676.1 predicted protein [Plenodomus lingam JN3]